MGRYKNYRIKIIDNKTYLVYNSPRPIFGIVEFISPIDRDRYAGPLNYAIYDIRYQIRILRMQARSVQSAHFHISPNYYYDIYKRRKHSNIETRKSPENYKKHVGIEIEFLSGFSEDSIKEAFIKKGLDRYVNLAYDSSVGIPLNDCEGECADKEHTLCYCSPYQSYELKVLVLQSEMSKILPKICQTLKEIGAFVNVTCGLHVHLDMRKRDVKRSFKHMIKTLLGVIA